MSKNTPVDTQFIKDCKSAAHRVLTAWSNDIKCYYDAGPCSKKDYVLYADHSWGTSQCDWSNDKKDLFDALKAVGAVNIIGRVKWNYVELAFDISQKRLIADGLVKVEPKAKAPAKTDYEKLHAWHIGIRKENLKACGIEKLERYYNICLEMEYTREAELLSNEMSSRMAV